MAGKREKKIDITVADAESYIRARREESETFEKFEGVSLHREEFDAIHKKAAEREAERQKALADEQAEPGGDQQDRFRALLEQQQAEQKQQQEASQQAEQGGDQQDRFRALLEQQQAEQQRQQEAGEQQRDQGADLER